MSETFNIEKCATTLDAINLINKSNAIAIVINAMIDHSQLKDISAASNSLIALESDHNGELIVYWRSEGMKEMLKVVLNRIQDRDRTLNVPSNIIIAFLMNCIRDCHNGESLLFYI
jgi:hypothetical protein